MMTKANGSPAAWEDAFRAVKGFVHENNRIPRKNAAPNSLAERRLADWSATQRAAQRRQTLSADRIALLESIPGWLWGVNGGGSEVEQAPSTSENLVQGANEVVDFFPNESA